MWLAGKEPDLAADGAALLKELEGVFKDLGITAPVDKAIAEEM